MVNTYESWHFKLMNENNNLIVETNFAIGDVVIHTKYNFRAVVVGVIYNVSQSVNYEKIKTALDYTSELENQVWYKLLIDDGEDLNFAPEIMLNSDSSATPVKHPLLKKYLTTNKETGIYKSSQSIH